MMIVCFRKTRITHKDIYMLVECIKVFSKEL